SCQSEVVPLVMQYPANLIYAQGMMTTTMVQLQQVELQISVLRGYMNAHVCASQPRDDVFRSSGTE
ncbi:unnamed protein product, partial [Polarella glacialis]